MQKETFWKVIFGNGFKKGGKHKETLLQAKQKGVCCLVRFYRKHVFTSSQVQPLTFRKYPDPSQQGVLPPTVHPQHSVTTPLRHFCRLLPYLLASQASGEFL